MNNQAIITSDLEFSPKFRHIQVGKIAATKFNGDHNTFGLFNDCPLILLYDMQELFFNVPVRENALTRIFCPMYLKITSSNPLEPISSHTIMEIPELEDANGNKFQILCKNDKYNLIKSSLLHLVKKPYRVNLNTPCYIDRKVNKGSKNQPYLNNFNFFWCMDNKDYGDWMGWFGSDYNNIFTSSYCNEYYKFITNNTDTEIRQLYQRALDW